MPERMPVASRTFARRLVARSGSGLLLAAWLSGAALAQSSSPFGNIAPPGGQPNRLPTTAPQPTTPAPPAPGVTNVLARVEGRPITQEQFDRIVNPYLVRLRAQMGAGFTDDVLKLARKNAFDELVRHEVLVIESQRQQIQVSEADTDSLLRQDPMLQTNGRFDPVKLQEFKLSPQSNYLQLLPRLQEYAAVAKLDKQVHDRFTPSRAEVRAEFEKRSAQVRFNYFPVQTRDVSLEPESTEPEWRAYFAAHGSDFVKRAQMRLRYYRLPLPAATDSTHAAAEKRAVERGHRMADSLRAGTLADSSAETRDTGLFDVAAPVIPGIGRPPELAAAIARADSLPSLRVLGAFLIPDAVLVPVVVERHPQRPQTFLEALPSVKRSADTDKRKAAADADRRAYYDANRERYRAARAALTRVTLKLATYKPRDIPAGELDRWYPVHGHTLYGLPDSARGWLPPLSDSLRRIIRGRIEQSERDVWVSGTLQKIASEMRTTRNVAGLARANGAVAETLSVVRGGTPADSLFSTAVVDSILATAGEQRGRPQGPRLFGGYAALWRVDSIDTAYVWPFEAIRLRLETDFLAEKSRKDEAEGRARFEAHHAEYLTPVKYTIEYVTVPIPPADSVRVSEAELKAEYQKNLASYRQEEQVHARHLLLSTREGGAGSDSSAKARADSLLAAIKGGADFVDLARRFSQDPGSGSQGGDLGWFGRGRMVPEFERATFALKPGEVSPVVKTQFGYHIIKLDERKAAGTKTFDEVQLDLRNSMRSARADTSARKQAEALRRRLAGVADPRPVAARYGGIKLSSSFAANEPAGELGFVQGLAGDIVKLSAGRWAPTPYRSGRSFIVLRLGHTIPPRPADWNEARTNAIQDTLAAKRRALYERTVAGIRAALTAGAKFDSLAAIHGGLRDSGPVSQGFAFVSGLGVEPWLVQRAFTVKAGEVSDTLQTAQGVAWLRVEEHLPGDPKQFEAAQFQITQDLLNKKYTPWLEQKKSALRIEILAPEFRAARPAAARGSVSGGG
jgi:peptidyl-prolyl cis-trans isomerase D